MTFEKYASSLRYYLALKHAGILSPPSRAGLAKEEVKRIRMKVYAEKQANPEEFQISAYRIALACYYTMETLGDECHKPPGTLFLLTDKMAGEIDNEVSVEVSKSNSRLISDMWSGKIT